MTAQRLLAAVRQHNGTLLKVTRKKSIVEQNNLVVPDRTPTRQPTTMMVSRDQIEKQLEKMSKLPVLPQILVNLNQVASDDKAS